ncbi:MAG TPA: hypothetical protein VKT75_13735 [Acidobacteriaceae bacterium]|nr:hypothetical protein [Acidobacteriaceae bacterium]
MRKHWLWTACMAVALPVSVAAQNAVTTSGNKADASAPDTHIRSNSLTNSTDQKIAPPPSKGGPTAKGPYGTCTVHVDNGTGYIVQFYFNGSLAGVMGPWGDLYPNITPGKAELYARAVFDDGTVLTFGPREFLCSGTDLHWTLTP